MNWFVSHQCHYKDNFDGETYSESYKADRERERQRESEREPQTCVLCCSM